MQRPWLATFVPAVVLAVMLAGCGAGRSGSRGVAAGVHGAAGSSAKAGTIPANAGGQSSHSTLSIAADPGGGLKFDKSSLTAKEGTVTINFTNRSSLEHNFTIEQNGRVVAATPTFKGGAKTLKLGLSPGAYTFICTLHAAAGMRGTLTIT
jgi:plastocyanin